MTQPMSKQCYSCRAPQMAKFCSRCGVSMTPLVACVRTPADGAYSHHEIRRFRHPLPSLTALEPEAVPVAQPEAKGDLRIATILFADVTAMSETLEASVFRLTDVIVGEGGTIDKYIGDCVIGDDGERAVRAGLRMQVVLGELAEEIELASGTKLQMRIGLNTGQVRAGYVGGKGHGAYTVMGDAVNLANRLESVWSRLNLCSHSRLVSDSYVLSDPEELTVKVKGINVLRERALTLQDGQEFFEGIPVPLVGHQGN